MFRRLCLLWFFFCSNASAASVAWEKGTGAESCPEAAKFQRDLEARLGRSWSEMSEVPQALRITIERAGKTFVAHIELRNELAELVGERTLSVRGDHCQAIEPYLSLAVALMLDPTAGLGEPEAPSVQTSPSAPDREPRTEPVAPFVREPPPPPTTAPVDSARPAAARVQGNGRWTVYVYPALWSPDMARQASDSGGGLTRLTQQMFVQRLLGREIYTVVEAPRPFDDPIRAEAWLRSAPLKAPPHAALASGQPAPVPDFVLQPYITSLVVEDGIDLSGRSAMPLVAVTIGLSLAGVDYRQRQEIEPLSASATIAVAGSRHDAKTKNFALRLALDNAVENAFLAMRREAAFRIRPRWAPATTSMALPSLRGVKSGDRFQFEKPDGERSGFAIARDVQINSARLEIWKSGDGERLVDVGSAPRIVLEWAIRSVQRLGYGQANAAERARASSDARAASRLGSVTELGVDSRYYLEARNGSRFRPFASVNFTIMKSDGVALTTGVQGGMGYEMAVFPALGLSMMPFVATGPLVMRGALGARDRSSVPLNGLIGITGVSGVRLELYRLFGAWSLTATAEAEYVAALYSLTPRSAYLDNRYPELHAFTVQIGCIYRPADYPD